MDQQRCCKPTVRLLEESACERPYPYLLTKSSDVAAELAARIVHERLYLSNDLVARLTDFSHSRGATLFMTLLTGFKTLLLLRSGRNDICVATMMANRSHVGVGARDRPFRKHHTYPHPN